MAEKERAAENSFLPIKLVIRGKGYEISTEGELSSIYKEIGALLEFQREIADRFEVIEEIVEEEEIPTEEEIAATPTADIPAIKPVASHRDNLRALFATPWGKTPRTLAEIMKALEVNGVYVPMTTMSATVIALVRRGELRRIQKEGKWAYYQIPGRA